MKKGWVVLLVFLLIVGIVNTSICLAKKQDGYEDVIVVLKEGKKFKDMKDYNITKKHEYKSISCFYGRHSPDGICVVSQHKFK